jgi:hypothetical protein
VAPRPRRPTSRPPPRPRYGIATQYRILKKINDEYNHIRVSPPAPPSAPDMILRVGIENRFTPASPKKHRCFFEPNRNAGNPVAKGAWRSCIMARKNVGMKAVCQPHI